MSWLSNLFHGSNPANAAMPYINQIPGQTNQYMQPYFNAGTGALSPLQEEYKKLLGDPGALMNKIGGSYKESPGFKASMDRALEAGTHASAAGGMAGTPEHQFNAMQTATDLSNKDYNNYLTNALGLYSQGLGGQQGMAQMGQNAGQNMANMIAQTLAQQGNLGFFGQNQQNQNIKDLIKMLTQGMGGLGGLFS